ncbi:serine/threonine-protein kinase HipA [Haloferula luteola]|uniref:Serine/threonine-protein kinase HipA n=1 Tax=Haloferula luteola TaxID=595692 RepID=A0A840VA58_9BACT|nr:type II toxin-antitoxin system HipA family toxin [Haloferula luteola]MBB5349801.1 serine/threonine-protein kinase HipA [Haloferula luteola]
MRLDVRFLGCEDSPRIGSLADDARGRIYFQYAPEWRTRGIELSPLHLPLSQPGPISSPTPGFGPLFGLFEDSMPDWWGQRIMRRHFAAMNLPWDQVRPLEKLACQGAYSLGAIAYEPDLSPASFRDTLTTEVTELVAAARQLLEDDPAELLPALVRGGLSPGGAQPKALVAFDATLSRAVAGGGPIPEGFVPWLVKFQLDRDDPVGAEEHAVTQLAEAVGIRTPETRLFPTPDGRVHFLTRRFDRQPHHLPRHLHTFAGLTHTPVREGLDYQDLLGLTRELTGRESEVEEGFLRAAFNIAIANDDDHARNHAYLWNPDDGWRLSPAYDLTRTSYPLGSGFRAAGIDGRFSQLTLKEIRKLGKDQGVRRMEEKLGHLLDTLRRWPEFAEASGLPEHRAAMLGSEMPASRW